jgi:hypothetical protein
MTLEEEFKKLVDEANEKLRIENDRKAAEDRSLMEELLKRQEALLNYFSKNESEKSSESKKS